MSFRSLGQKGEKNRYRKVISTDRISLMAVEWRRRVGWRVGYPFPVAAFEERYLSR